MCNCFCLKKSSSTEYKELDEFFPISSNNFGLGRLVIFGNHYGTWTYAFTLPTKHIPYSYFAARDGEYVNELPKGSSQHWKPCKPGQVFESTINAIFLSTGGQLDYFQALFQDGNIELHKELTSVGLDRIQKILKGRPLRTKLFHQISSNIHLNSDIAKFWREYVDFSMYFADSGMFPGDNLEISEKILKCEFFFLNCILTNPECLEQFNGWGLVVGHADKNHLTFQSIYDIVMNWYSGKHTPQKYYLLQFDQWNIPEDLWDEIVALSKEINYVDPMYPGTEYEITRKDGEKCTVGKRELVQTAYFYLGGFKEEFYNFGACVKLC